jgi:hypothetical protein
LPHPPSLSKGFQVLNQVLHIAKGGTIVAL